MIFSKVKYTLLVYEDMQKHQYGALNRCINKNYDKDEQRVTSSYLYIIWHLTLVLLVSAASVTSPIYFHDVVLCYCDFEPITDINTPLLSSSKCDYKLTFFIILFWFMFLICASCSRGLSRSSLDHHPLPEETDDNQTPHRYLHDLQEAVSTHNR